MGVGGPPRRRQVRAGRYASVTAAPHGRLAPWAKASAKTAAPRTVRAASSVRSTSARSGGGAAGVDDPAPHVAPLLTLLREPRPPPSDEETT
ncbi:hypothetical protein [Streptomyces zaomyceticus]|uniref:hypothetical protein n=1 Tax=Streptomyces zaomyceticus TaxID=68286 RepID=UPI002E1104AE|nr:hypothetical protein OG237_14330 [Streptomyces zaomyceticus]